MKIEVDLYLTPNDSDHLITTLKPGDLIRVQTPSTSGPHAVQYCLLRNTWGAWVKGGVEHFPVFNLTYNSDAILTRPDLKYCEKVIGVLRVSK